eukprot:g42488.t1
MKQNTSALQSGPTATRKQSTRKSNKNSGQTTTSRRSTWIFLTHCNQQSPAPLQEASSIVNLSNKHGKISRLTTTATTKGKPFRGFLLCNC